LLTKLINNAVSPFVLSLDSLFFVSVLFISFAFESFFDELRSRKRARVSLSSTSRKKIK
jgi:hypothetical protein